MQVGDKVYVVATDERLKEIGIGTIFVDRLKVYRIRKTDPVSAEGLYYQLSTGYWFGYDDLERAI